MESVWESGILELLGEKLRDVAEQDSPEQAVDRLLAYLGEMLKCGRIEICEENENGKYDITHEWCAPNVIPAKDLMRDIDFLSDPGIFDEQGELLVHDIHTIKEKYPKLYEDFARQDVIGLQCVPLKYNGIMLGHLGAENVPEEQMEMAQDILRVVSLMVSQMVSTKHLVDRLERTGFSDRLTGLGNRHALYDRVDHFENVHSIGLVYADVTGLKETNDQYGHEAGDRLLITAAKCFTAVFGEDCCYRVGGDEFVCLALNMKEEVFRQKLTALHLMFRDEKMHIAIGDVYEPDWTTDFDLLIRKADLRMYDDKRAFYREQSMTSSKPMSRLETLHELILEARLSKDSYHTLYGHDHDLDLAQDGSYSELIAQSENEYIYPDDRETFHTLAQPEELKKNLLKANGADLKNEYRVISKEGGWKKYQLNVILLDASEEDFRILVIIRNLSARSIHFRVNEEEAPDAHVDLYRGAVALQRAGVWISQCASERFVVLSIDINHFRLYNNIFGTAAGDCLLELIGKILLAHVKKHGGVAGYIDGDNFILVESAELFSGDELCDIIERLVTRIGIPSHFLPHIGVCISNDRTLSVNDLYEKALLAADTMRDNPFMHVAIYDEKSFMMERDDQMLLIDFEKAMADHEIIFWLQPKVYTKDRKVISCEALVRWQKESHLIMPASFVPLLERNDQITVLDLYIWKEVIIWQKKLMDQGLRPIPVSLNVSSKDFQLMDVADTICSLLKEYGVPAKYIQIELPKGIYFDIPEEIKKQTVKLNEAGIVILLDDFGNDYPSLQELRESDVDIMKIEKNLMDQMLANETDFSIIDNMRHLANLSGGRIVAEGIETESQVKKLEELDLNFAQGYYFYRPISPYEMEKIIANDDLVLREADKAD